MNGSKYRVPEEDNREVITLKKFCADCKNDPQKCEQEPSSCLEEANIYRKFTKIKRE